MSVPEPTGAPSRSRLVPAIAERDRRAALLLAAAAFLIGVLLTALGAHAYMRESGAEAQARFQRLVDRLASETRRRLNGPLHGINGIRGVYAASAEVNRAEFADFVATLDMGGEFRGVRGFGYVERVPRADLDAFVARTRADGTPAFEVRGGGNSEDLFVVKYIEPLHANLQALGLDVGAEAVRRETIERAIVSGAPVLSSMVRLVQDGAGRPGFLLTAPIYRRGADPSTPEQRRAALVGMAYAPMVIEEVLAGASEITDRYLDLTLYDAATADPSRIVFAEGGQTPSTLAAAPAAARKFTIDRTIDVGGRTLVLRAASTPAFDATVDRVTPALIVAGGSLLSGLLSLTLWLLASRRARAEAMARSMTASLDRLAMVARHTSNAVVITDATRRITWVNEGFTRITGHTLESALGRSPGEMLQCPRTDAATVQRMRDAFDAGKGFRGEIINRGLDGHEYWIELEVTPLRDATGELTGFMAIESDISERKAAEAALQSARREVERLARVAERTSNAVIIADRDKRITWVNQGFERIYGYESAEVLGRTPGEVLGHPGASLEAVETLARSALSAAGCRVEILNRTRDGRDVWIDTEVQPLFDDLGELSGFVEIASDITLQKQAQLQLAAAMRETEALLSTIRQHAIVSVCDSEGVIVDVNEAFCEISGYSRVELLGSTHRLIGSGQQTAAFWDGMWRTIASGRPWRGQICNRSRDGSLYWVDSIIAPFAGIDGDIEKYVSISSDITASRQAAGDLARERQRLSDIVAGTGAGTWEFDFRTGADHVNERYAAMLGYGVHEMHALMQGDFLRLVHPEDRADVWARRSRHLAGQDDGVYEVEFRMRHKDGRWRWIHARGKVTSRDADGAPERIAGIHLDIDERKRTESELQRERQRLSDIVEGTGAGTWEYDFQTGDDTINERYASMLGFGLDELRDLMRGDFTRLVHPGDLERVLEVRQLHAAQGDTSTYEVEYRMRHKDGSWRWIHSRGKVIAQDAQGRALKIAGIHLDVTARKDAEREISRQRQRLDNILEGTHVGTWEWNVETGQTHFNERWADIIGYTLEELGPTSIQTWVQYTHPEDLSRSSVLLERHFNGEIANYECEARMRHKDGHWVWVLDRGKLFSRSEDGRPRWMAGTHMDITERKRAEAALRASQDFLDRVGRIAGVGGWEIDLATQRLQWSRQTRRMHDVDEDFEPTVEQAVGFYAPEARDQVAAAVARAVDGGGGFDLEVPLVTAIGRHIWVRAVGEVEFEDGQPARVVGAFQDVTARRELEAEVRRQNELMSTVMANLPCGLTVFDAQRRLLAWNEQLLRLLDLPAELVARDGVRFDDIVRFNAERGEYGDGPVDAAVEQAIARVDGPIAPHRFERARPNGVPLEISGAPMPGGGWVTTYTDISERRRAEREVQRSAALMRAAIDAVGEAFVLYDPDDRLVFCNEKYRDLYRESAEAIVPGARFEDILRFGAERGQYAEAVGRIDDWIAERMQSHREGNRLLVQRLGDGRWLRVVERLMPDGHIVGFRIDITDLVNARQSAEEASRSKSQFLANMSHEIRTPMNAILGMLSLLQRTPLDSRQREYAAKTEGAARSLLGLLNDILDFSKVEAGKMTLDPQPFRLDRLLRDLSVILAANVGAKPLEVLFDVGADVPRVLVGDAMRLQQVLINLGGNAVKFTPSGEVVLSVAVAGRGADTVRLSFEVRDTGIGIAPEHRQRIFSGFTQAEASTTRRFGGTGLGLAICQRMVALMGGELALESAPGQGSRFHFTIDLPLADAAALPLAQAAPPRPGLRLLILDDSASARDLLGRMAGSLGWRVDAAADAGEAEIALDRAIAERRPHDVLLVDAGVAGGEGLHVAARLRARFGAADVPLVVMLGTPAREAVAADGADAGFTPDGHLLKPVTASMLLDAINDARVTSELGHLSQRQQPGTAPRLPGLRLLVVEDNPNNQQVARELLEGEGAQVEIAGDGLAGVEAVARAAVPYDVVLMDIQMPVMDGLTAASRIRGELGLASLPIVAMTANAMASDREACLAVGMNDHVGKPFDLDHLVAVLLRLSGRDAEPGRSPAPSAVLDGGVVDAARQAGVDLSTAVRRLGGNVTAYARMARAFARDAQGLAAQFDAARAGGSLEEGARLSHTLKGLAATLGAVRLSEGAASCEQALREAGGQWPDLSPLLAQLSAVARCLLDLSERLAPTPTAAAIGSLAGTADPVAMRALLDELASLLRDSDMRAIDVHAELVARFGPALGDRREPLDAAVSSLDFAAALPHCEAARLEVA